MRANLGCSIYRIINRIFEIFDFKKKIRPRPKTQSHRAFFGRPGKFLKFSRIFPKKLKIFRRPRKRLDGSGFLADHWFLRRNGPGFWPILVTKITSPKVFHHFFRPDGNKSTSAENTPKRPK